MHIVDEQETAPAGAQRTNGNRTHRTKKAVAEKGKNIEKEKIMKWRHATVFILAFLIFVISGCGRTEEETAAINMLREKTEEYSSILETDTLSVEYCTSMLEFRSDVMAVLNEIEVAHGFNEELLDSLQIEYSILVDSVSSILEQNLLSLSENVRLSSISFIESIKIKDILDISESTVGFDIYGAEPSSWRLRNIEIEELHDLADSISATKQESMDKETELEELYNLCSEENIPVESLLSTLDSLDVLSDTLFAITCRLRGLKNDATHAIDLQRFNYLSSRVRATEDPAINREFISHINSPYYVNSRNHMCYLYISKRPSGSFGYLRFKVGYTRSNWVFVDQIFFNIDGSIVNVPFNEYDDLDDSISGGQVSEWIDIRADEDLIELLIGADEVYVTFQGRNERYSRQLTSSDLTALAEMLEYHRLMPSCNEN